MNVLLLTYHFAPFNHIGAVRCVKTSKYLTQSGNRVRVLAAGDQPFPRSLELEVDPATVEHVPCPHLDRIAQVAVGSGQRGTGGGKSSRGIRSWPILRWTYNLYKTVSWYPDNVAGWQQRLLAAARRAIADQRPDVILASGPPYTPFIVAAKLSRETGIPWVCELRDLWVDNDNYAFPAWRRHLEDRLERRTLSTASALVTVSDPLAQTLKTKYALPTYIVTNGYEPDDYTAPVRGLLPKAGLNIVYTGFLYQEKQDIVPLLDALATLVQQGIQANLHLYGRGFDSALDQARSRGIEHLVATHGNVPYRDALSAQREADVLLLLTWNDEKETGVYSGKLFEYLGARRPILCVGHFDTVATELVRDRRAGYVSGDCAELARILGELSAQKLARGRIPDLPEDVGAGFSREEQVGRLREVLCAAISDHGEH